MELCRAIPLTSGGTRVPSPIKRPAAPSWKLVEAGAVINRLTPTEAQLQVLGQRFFERLQRVVSSSFDLRVQEDLARESELGALLTGAVALALLDDDGLVPAPASHAVRLRALLRDELFQILEQRESPHRELAALLLCSADLVVDRHESLVAEQHLAFYRHDPDLSAAVEASLATLSAGQRGPALAALVPRPVLEAPRVDRPRPAEQVYQEARRWLLAGRALGVEEKDLHRMASVAELLAALNEAAHADGSIRRHRYFLLSTLDEQFQACDAYLECRPGRPEHVLYHLRPYEEFAVFRKRQVLRTGATPTVEEQVEETRFFVDLVRLATRVAPSRICVLRLWQVQGEPLERIEQDLSAFKTTRPVEPPDLELFELHRTRFRPLFRR